MTADSSAVPADLAGTVPLVDSRQQWLATQARLAARDVWVFVRERGLREGRWGWTELPAGVQHLPAVLRLREQVAAVLDEPLDTCTDTQLLLRLPDADTPHAHEAFTEHVDVDPQGNPYRLVAGCALSPAPYGAVRLSGGVTTYGHMPGDLFVWPGHMRHRGVLNTGSVPRVTAYWRWP